MTDRNRKRGYTFIELLFVILIIGVLAAIAIPVYKAQMISAKLTEVTNAISHLASSLANYRLHAVQVGSTNEWPNCGSIAEIQMSLGVGLAALERIKSASVNQVTGAISITVTKIDSTVDGSTITLTPSTSSDGSISWIWGGTIPPKYLPRK